jgi:NADH-quinone oxidoreductase subunit C
MSLIEEVKAKFGADITETLEQRGDAVVYVKRESLLKVMKALKSDAAFKFDFLMDVFAVDYLHWEEKALRFEVVYNLFSSEKQRRLFVKAAVPERDAALDSVSSVWPAADWYERETWDMFGITFKGHPNLKRILMYEGFEGHALRKDYPYNKRQPLIGPLN